MQREVRIKVATRSATCNGKYTGQCNEKCNMQPEKCNYELELKPPACTPPTANNKLGSVRFAVGRNIEMMPMQELYPNVTRTEEAA